MRVEITFIGVDCAVGDKWDLTSPVLHFTPGEQDIPSGATTTHTLTWDVVLPPSAVTNAHVELVKTHGAGAGPAPVLDFYMNVDMTSKPAPAPSGTAPSTTATSATAPTAGTAPQVPAMINKTPWIFLTCGLIAFLGAIGLVAYLLWIFSGMAASGFSAQAAPAITATQTSVVTTVEQRVVTSDPTVALEATKASASITH